tara:strand:+ start:180 stop:497 length:318 start_codon:yes stop_codon:yes gene_type:complete
MIETKKIEIEKIQKCGCEQDDCVEILGLEDAIYACFTCGYAGVTPSSNEYPKEEIHIGSLYREVLRLREGIRKRDTLVDTMNTATEVFIHAYYELSDYLKYGEEE